LSKLSNFLEFFFFYLGDNDEAISIAPAGEASSHSDGLRFDFGFECPSSGASSLP
jgi:hypothetical protein